MLLLPARLPSPFLSLKAVESVLLVLASKTQQFEVIYKLGGSIFLGFCLGRKHWMFFPIFFQEKLMVLQLHPDGKKHPQLGALCPSLKPGVMGEPQQKSTTNNNQSCLELLRATYFKKQRLTFCQHSFNFTSQVRLKSATQIYIHF